MSFLLGFAFHDITILDRDINNEEIFGVFLQINFRYSPPLPSPLPLFLICDLKKKRLKPMRIAINVKFLLICFFLQMCLCSGFNARETARLFFVITTLFICLLWRTKKKEMGKKISRAGSLNHLRCHCHSQNSNLWMVIL